MTLTPEQVLEALRNLAEARGKFDEQARSLDNCFGAQQARFNFDGVCYSTDFPALLAAVEGQRQMLIRSVLVILQGTEMEDAHAVLEIRDRLGCQLKVAAELLEAAIAEYPGLRVIRTYHPPAAAREGLCTEQQ